MRWVWCCIFLLTSGVAWASNDLAVAIENVRTACGGISAELSDMKTMAGINTAVTGVGTVAGGVALGTGVAKTKVDKRADEYQEMIDALVAMGAKQVTSLDMFYETYARALSETGMPNGQALSAQLQNKKHMLEQRSKKLGNWRTGTMAVGAAANIAGAIIAGENRVRGDLKTQIDECLISVKTLSGVRMQAHISKSATDTELERAEKIIAACDEWGMVDISSINNKSTGAAVSSGVGTGLGIAGTVTSAVANSDKVREGDSDKEKKLNAAANVLAGGMTIASATATVFNASQISAIKRAVQVAEQCEEVMK